MVDETRVDSFLEIESVYLVLVLSKFEGGHIATELHLHVDLFDRVCTFHLKS